MSASLGEGLDRRIAPFRIRTLTGIHPGATLSLVFVPEPNDRSAPWTGPLPPWR